ncbi:hypothetical protein PybrP1_000457 [[Pythium] brassicae (nom. inval.)]|nr:hypothetical protein PybrP1_000457 [[Pythium] brassicae (nom. inval.)]
MKLPLPRDFFAPVRLQPEEAVQLRLVAARLLAAHLARFDAFHSVESDSWKFVRRRGDVRIFRRRRRRRRAGPRYESTDECEHAELPGVLAVGSVAGTVEELLYGLAWRSGEQRRARALFTGDGVADAALLVALEEPTADDPFHSLGVRWTLRKAPRGSVLVRDRDFCFLSATGVLRTQYGEKVGYELSHSIRFPSCPPFANSSVVRAQLFECSFFRQLKRGRVEIFHQGAFDAAGELPAVLAARAAAASLPDFARLLESSFAKKLARAVAGSDERLIAASISSARESVGDEQCCGMCLKRLGSARTRSCAICRHYVCPQCSVRKEVQPLGPSPARTRARCFCGSCVSKVLHDDALIYATRDAEADRPDALEARAPPSSSRWDFDEIDDEELVPRSHAVVLVAPDARTFDVEKLETTKPRQLNKYGAPLGSNRSLASSLRRSVVSPRYHQLSTAPDVLLRSDAGKRHWGSSTSALSLQSPQRILTPRGRGGSVSPAGGSASRLVFVGRLSSSSLEGNAGSAKSQQQRRFFRDLYPR